MLPLSSSSLRTLSARLDTPTYERRSLRQGVVHIGVGGFHRSHQAVYLDELARSGHTKWGEVGIGLCTPRMRNALQPQDGLFTVTELDNETERSRVVGVMTDYLFGPDDPRAVVRRLAAPETRVVTLTVTGDGYNELPARKAQAWTQHLVAALAIRRREKEGGLTVLSCDNLADAGVRARAAVLRCADSYNQVLARWIEHNVTFPDSMVDRITPTADDGMRALVRRRFGVEDLAPVVTEPFTQWVIEDQFCRERPPLEEVGVQMVADVTPYKMVKTRLLNGTHTAMSHLGWLAGHRTSVAVVEDPLLRAFVTELMEGEVAPLLPALPEMPTGEYTRQVLARLANRSIADPLARLCGRGSTKVPSYVLPSLVEARRNGHPAPLLTLAVAAWFRYLSGSDLEGQPIDVVDVRRDRLQPLAVRGRLDPSLLLAQRDVMGDLGDDVEFRRGLREALRDLELGVEHAIRRRLPCAASSRPLTLVTGGDTGAAQPRSAR